MLIPCKKCQKPVSNAAAYCPYCGTALGKRLNIQQWLWGLACLGSGIGLFILPRWFAILLIGSVVGYLVTWGRIRWRQFRNRQESVAPNRPPKKPAIRLKTVVYAVLGLLVGGAFYLFTTMTQSPVGLASLHATPPPPSAGRPAMDLPPDSAQIPLVASPTIIPAGTALTGRVIEIHDGDTLTLLVPDGTSFKQIKVRLGEIDTPERKQPYGTRAQQTLSELAFNQQARVVVQDTDRYGRTVGRVYVGGVDVNAEMIRQGAAWAYRQYLKDQSLLTLEAEAKAAKRGLWGLPEAERCPPWDWRKNACPTSAATPAPASPAASAPTATTSGGFTCAGKRYCREMTSCEEAKFYLTQCGVRSLDGNHDGVPCERLCR